MGDVPEGAVPEEDGADGDGADGNDALRVADRRRRLREQINHKAEMDAAVSNAAAQAEREDVVADDVNVAAIVAALDTDALYADMYASTALGRISKSYIESVTKPGKVQLLRGDGEPIQELRENQVRALYTLDPAGLALDHPAGASNPSRLLWIDRTAAGPIGRCL